MLPDAEIVFNRLEEIGSDHARVLHDSKLNAALDAFRGEPLPFRCAKKGCHAVVLYLGLPAKCTGVDPVHGRPTRRCDNPDCISKGCQGGYVAGQRPLRVEGGRVVFATNAPRRERYWSPEAHSASVGPQPPFPYDTWSIDSAWDGCTPSPFADPWAITMHQREHLSTGSGCPPNPKSWEQADPSGQWLRIRFTCAQCGTPRVLTNTSLLRAFVRAKMADAAEVLMG